MEDEGLKNILKSEALKQYINETSVYPREHQELKEIRNATAEKYPVMSVMVTSPDEVQFLSMLVKMLNAKKTIEIGVFTGYSILATALALPEDGIAIGIDTDREAYEVGLPFIQNAGVQHKIKFLQSDAKSGLDHLLSNQDDGDFDFAFVDADKENYETHHHKLMKLIKVGGIIAYDNTLWFGSVALKDDDEMPDFVRKFRDITLKRNSYLASDPRIEISHISIGDGLILCRRLY
ncbi:hypothetical protein ACHQM5_010587 [Ranunculus cassubicifolius]